MMASLQAAEMQTSSLIRDAVGRYVLDRRTAEGGYSYYRTPQWGVEEPNAPDTLAALECLRILAIKPPGHERTGRWLRGLQTRDGNYPTLRIGWAALRALNIMGVEPRRSSQRWLAHWAGLLLGRDRPREWHGALVDALHLVELLRLTGEELDVDQRSALSQRLASARDPSGGWARPGADLETTAVAVRLAALASLSRQPAAVAAFLACCEDEALGLRFAPGAGMTSAGALWGGLELFRMLRVAPSYPSAIAESLALLQRPDGGLAARHRAISTLRDTWLGLSADQLLQQIQEERP
jgi:hypothetical protein